MKNQNVMRKKKSNVLLMPLKNLQAKENYKLHLRGTTDKEGFPSILKMKSLKSVSRQRKQEVKNFLSEGDAEFLFQKAKNGQLYFRVGQVWKIPKRKGMTALLCDYDGTNKIYHRMMKRRLKIAGVEVVSIKSVISPSGFGVHAIVWVRGRFSRYERIALEAILESDPDKAAQDFRRAGQAGKQWRENWHVLFKKGK